MSSHEGSGEKGQAPPPWAGQGAIRWRVGIGCLVLGALGWLADGWINDQTDQVSENLGGDLYRELYTLQQFGGLSSIGFLALIVWLIDPARRRRLLDLFGAFLVTGVVVQFFKMFIGRPRPKFGDPGILLWPWGAYPIERGDESSVYHAWEFYEPIRSELWSMPSSHTSSAVVLAVWVAVVYPRLRPLMIGMVVLVGTARVIFGAHFLSDIFIGAGIGFVTAHAAIRGYWGVRFMDWFWVRAVNPKAQPALAAVLRADR